MKYELDRLIEDIVRDYSKFPTHDGSRRSEESVEKFRNEIEISEGSKYIRIETGTSVWGFINKSNNNFNPGDIFKPKNWKTPTLNRARGNILSGKYSIKWTGPLYLHDIAGKGYYSWADNEIAKSEIS